MTCLNDSKHSFHWSTGPVCNQLPNIDFLVTSGISASGLENTNVLWLFDFSQIKCITQQAFSTIQSMYAIPAVCNVWHRERDLLLCEVKSPSFCIASDMQINSPRHTGLFGSGSSTDVDKTVILDTQIINVLTNATANISTNLDRNNSSYSYFSFHISIMLHIFL